MKPTPPPKTLIESTRLRAGLTQSEAGAMIYTALRTWQHWEAGDRAMHPGLWELFLIKLTQRQS